MTERDPLVRPAELAERLRTNERLRVLDGSWHMPASGRDPRAEVEAQRVPGAVFFDIDRIRDQTVDLPHMLPSPEAFSEHAGLLGVDDQTPVVVYDQLGLFSAARVWWTFRVMGKADVQVLDGGLPAWIRAGYATSSGPLEVPPKGRFTPTYAANLVKDFDAMRALVSEGAFEILDARPPERFEGRAEEPRPGLRKGHMPGAKNVPYASLLDDDGFLLDAPELERVFALSGVDLRRPVVTTCGSGVSAAVVSLALARLGRFDAAVYDGSWAEWGASEAPVAVGAVGR